MRKRNFILSVLLLCSLTGCGQQTSAPGQTGQKADAFRTYFMYDVAIDSADGFYYLNPESFMKFFDYTAKTETIVCNKPSCKHEPWSESTPLEERCGAYVSFWSTGFVEGGKLYIMEGTSESRGTRQIRIIESDLDRTDQREVVALDSDSVYSFAVKDKMLYAIVDQVEMTGHEDGTQTSGSRKKATLCSIDLSDGTVRALMEKEDFSAVVTVMAAEGDRLYLNYSYFKKPFDGTNYKEAAQQAEYYEYSIESGELRQILCDWKDDQIMKSSLVNGTLYALTAPMDRSMNEGERTDCNLVKIDLMQEKVEPLCQATDNAVLYENYAIYEKEDGKGWFVYDFRKGREMSAPKMNLDNFYPYYAAGEYIYGNLEDAKTKESTMVFVKLKDLMEGKDAFLSAEDSHLLQTSHIQHIQGKVAI